MSNICNKCKSNKVIFHRPYSGEFLCKECFLHSIESKVKKTISKFSMLKYGDKVAVAVSGGKDSLTLLQILKKIQKEDPNLDLIAITVDEGIKDYREESLQIVKNFCASIKVSNKIISFKEQFQTGMDEAVQMRPSRKLSSCSICGTFRRRSLDVLAESSGSNVIATGHNLDDHLQTFLINLFAGDVQRIGWTYPHPVEYGPAGIKKIKPMIELYEQEIVLYAMLNEIPFQSEECPYMNESIRGDIRKFFNTMEKSHPGIKYNLYNSILKISNSLKKSNTNFEHKKCSECGKDSSGAICSVCKTINILNDE